MLIKLLLACLILSGCANGGWSREDTYRHAAFTTLMVVDYSQTMEISREPDKYRERNPFLGEHPSEAAVTGWFIGTYAANTAIAMALPPRYRKWFQYVSIGVEVGCVANNFSIGLGFGF